MPQIRELLARKGSEVITISPETSVLEATQLMNRRQVGALVVMQEGQIAGMFTERDVLRRVVAMQVNPSQIPISEVMTTGVACATLNTELDEAASVMKNRRIRHLPVCDELGQLHGIVSIGDINAWYADDKETTIHFLNQYIHGRV